MLQINVELIMCCDKCIKEKRSNYILSGIIDPIKKHCFRKKIK
jgi:hypothetical protein